MSKATFFLLATLGFAVATVAVGIRGLENWEAYELSGYYFLLAWGASDVYRRRVEPTTG
ncbi:hypothetical protein [Rubrivirga sp. IMCC43871]|uniref:hypothetical protein n=1 Tax=Rubrivirga sp. IMCC43871 TaxID=3391575 RepID=UPI00398FE9B4